MLAVCAWATAIGLVGLGGAVRAVATVTAGAGPAWFERTFAAVGTAAVVLTAAALLTARWTRPPWFLLALATVPAAVNVGLTVGVL